MSGIAWIKTNFNARTLMDKKGKMELYDKICMELTNYENSENTEEVNLGYLQEFYGLLVRIQNCWDDLTGNDN